MSTYLHIAVEGKTSDGRWVPMHLYHRAEYDDTYSLHTKNQFIKYDEENKKYITQYDLDVANLKEGEILKNPLDIVADNVVYAEDSLLCGNYTSIREAIYDSELCDFDSRGFPDEWKDPAVRMNAYGNEYDPDEHSWGKTWCTLSELCDLSKAIRTKWISELKEAYSEYFTESVKSSLSRIEYNLMSLAKNGQGCKVKAAPKKKNDEYGEDDINHNIEYMFEESFYEVLNINALCSTIGELSERAFGYLKSSSDIRLIMWCS